MEGKTLNLMTIVFQPEMDYRRMPPGYEDRIVPDFRDRRSRVFPGGRNYDPSPVIIEPRAYPSRGIRDTSPFQGQRVPGGRVVYEKRIRRDRNDREVAGYLDYDIDMEIESRPMVIDERDYLREKGYRRYSPREEIVPMITDRTHHRGRRYDERIEEVIPEYYRNGHYRHDRRYGERVEEVFPEDYRNGRYDSRRYEKRIEEVVPDYRNGGYRWEHRGAEIIADYPERGYRSRRGPRVERVEHITPDDYRGYDRNYYMPERPRSAPSFY